MPAAEVMAHIEELQEQLAQSKRLLLMLCACPDYDSAKLRELASSAVMAEQLVSDLSLSLAVHNSARPIRLLPHQIKVLQTAALVERNIGFVLERTVDATAGSYAIH